ncbi:MAG: hybrid sensor histidine kinase/response regulator [Tepidisphaeraceae bacterium]
MRRELRQSILPFGSAIGVIAAVVCAAVVAAYLLGALHAVGERAVRVTILVLVVLGLCIAALAYYLGRANRMTRAATDAAQRMAQSVQRTEQGLARSEERYRTFVQQSSEGIWRVEFEQPISTALPEDRQIDLAYQYGFLDECNDAMARMYGFSSSSEITGARLGELLHRDDPRNIEFLRSFVRSGYRLNGAESHEVEPNGRSKHFRNTLVGIVEDGSLVRAWGTQQDVTEQRIAQEALRLSEERFRHLADSAPMLMWMSDADRKFTWLNRRWLEFVGRGVESELGDGWAHSIHPDDREICVRAFAESFDARRDLTMEFRLRRHDAVWRWVLASGIPLHGPEGEFTGYIGSCIDITDRKSAEEQRDLVLASERSARGEAERAGRMKDEFLATLSHELRTPLNAILGWAQLLRSGRMSATDVTQGLETIERNSRAQAQLIEDLLDMSRIISGKIRLDVQRVDLVKVIEAAIGSVRPAADAREIRLQKVLDSRAGLVSGDPGRLQQIVWNLLTNAIKFTPKQGRVQVILERVESQVEITVNDTGQGIKPEFLPHVFERFRQADASTTRVHSGLGLGLSIVRHLVEMHGGSVRAHSAGEGKGATFTASLPVLAIHAPETGADRVGLAADTAFGAESPQLDGLKVLVVDDEPDARELVRRLLVERHANVTIAGSSEEALAAMGRELPDVLISDIGMPAEDGYTLIQKVRMLDAARGGKIPAVALTAFARSEDRRRSLHAGFQMHVSKPVEPAELIAVVASLGGRMLIGQAEDGQKVADGV